jgi:cell division protein FtsZ
MTLGVPGEERKMETPVAVAPAPEKKAEPVAPLMPTVHEYTPPVKEPVIFSTPVQAPVADFNPVISSLENEEDEQPIIFELSIDSPAIPETPAAPVFVTPEPVQQPETSEPVKMSNDHPLFNSSFLNKPSQIYTSPVQHQIKEEEKKEAPLPLNQPVAQDDDINSITLTEEAMPVMKEIPAEEEELAGITLSYQDAVPEPRVQSSLFNEKLQDEPQDLSEEEEQKRRAQERINRLRSLSFNPMHMDNNSEFENVPAYMRRNMELHNSIANVEDFYSRAQVKSNDNNQATISTLNNFLHGEKPD